MNVIIVNKNKYMLENLGVDIIKELEGEFDADQIIATFQNFFYQRMILDITALKNYTDISVLQKLSISLDMDKLILLLDGTEATYNPQFLSNLVGMGIYNFAKDVEGIQYLYNSPNSYRDVAQFHQLNTAPVVEEQPPKPSGLAGMFNFNKQPQPTPQPVSVPTPQPTINNYQPIEAENTFVNVEETSNAYSGNTRIIGIKNITRQSGATSLAYMMMKELSKSYDVIAIEVDKNDFNYFKDNRMISSNSTDIELTVKKYSDKDVIILDTNNSGTAEQLCTEILYLIEPSIIKLNKLMSLNAQVLSGLKGKKVILNQSLLNDKDINTFEYESRVKVYHNLGPLNERSNNLEELDILLNKLGFSNINS